jgi:hypothetical protein
LLRIIAYRELYEFALAIDLEVTVFGFSNVGVCPSECLLQCLELVVRIEQE